MDRLPHGGSWPFFGAHSLRDDAKTPAKRVALAGQPSLAQLLPCYRGVMGFWEHWRWSRLFPSWDSFILMALLRNFTTNDERSSFKLDLVLGQSGAQAQGGVEWLWRFRDPNLRGLRTEANWPSAITR